MKKSILFCVIIIISPALLIGQQSRLISIDVNYEKGMHNKFFQECIGAGRANEGLRADWQLHLKTVKQECGFKYIRFHGIFHDDMGTYKESKEGDPIYNWQYVDKLYDFILSIDMKPFVELSFMPTDLASGQKEAFWWKGNTSKYKSQIKYKEFIQAFVKHLTGRYGESEVSTWYFEVWNEPDHPYFYGGTKEDYFEMYSTAVAEIKRISPKYRVGGPATAGASWLSDFLDFCYNEKVPVDFLSTHTYNVHGFVDEFGDKQLKLSSNPLGVVNHVSHTFEKLENHALQGIELHYTEWSSSYSPVDPVHDTYQNATFVLNTLKNAEGMPTSMSYWVFTDIFEEVGPPFTPFHGGFGLLNLQGIRKPTYFVYKYLNQLGHIELMNSDDMSWACKSENEVQVLVYDFSYPDQGDATNKEFFTRKHKAETASDVSISLKNLSNGNYQLVVFRTGYMSNDAFSAYYDLGLPSQLNLKQEEFLKSQTNDQPQINTLISITDGSYDVSLNMNQNDIVLVKLSKLN